MSDTDAARIELYDIAKQKVDERFAELLMKMLPHDPERNATKDDVEVLGANVRAEMAELGGNLRTEMAELGGNLRTEMAELGGNLRTEMAELGGNLRTEMAELGGNLRTEMADLRTGMADLRTELRTEMADLRIELRTGLADVRTEIAGLRTDFGVQIHEATAAQTRTMVFSLVGSVTALTIANTVALGIFS